jgi:hypothetical protein
MRYQVTIALIAPLLACVPDEDSRMTSGTNQNQMLAISANCRGNEECLFDGQDLFLDIKITNQHNSAVGFPLAFRQKTGPIIRLIDPRSKRETHLRTNLADLDLQDQFTMIPAGGTAVLEWVITAADLRQFAAEHIDVIVEITVMAKISVNGKPLEFQGIDTLRIRDKEEIQRSAAE